MSEQIVIGRMLDPMRIRTEQTTIELDDWAKRAMWSFLRLQFGRSIDQEIKKRRDDWIWENYHIETKFADKSILKKAMEHVFNEILSVKIPDRETQFILEGSKVMAVASLKHLLVSPERVYGMAAKIIQKQYPQISGLEVSQLSGLTYEVKQVAGFKVGLQVFGGDILTRQAITVSSWLRVEQCFNPLSWLGIGAFHSFIGKRTGDFERVLRIKVITDLKPRLQQGIELALKRSQDIEDRVKVTQKVSVKRSDAEIIMAALGLSYSLGSKTIEQILERLSQEPKTQWGMSMASSYVAAHGKFKETPEGQDRRVEQKLSTISGAALLIDDLKDAKERSIEWLQEHVKEGEVKRLDDLLRDLGVKKVKKQ
jgi:hypothetical protein